jgi:hypothetical protein
MILLLLFIKFIIFIEASRISGNIITHTNMTKILINTYEMKTT